MTRDLWLPYVQLYTRESGRNSRARENIINRFGTAQRVRAMPEIERQITGLIRVLDSLVRAVLEALGPSVSIAWPLDGELAEAERQEGQNNYLQ